MEFGIVEDNREDFIALCRVLGPAHQIRRWESAEQVLAAFRTGGADELSMLFVDCGLPGIDGIELVRQLRAHAAGVDRFESKGMSIDDFKASVARCLAIVDGAPDVS